ncbi:MAG: chorismate mutase [Thalassobium sp.]|nr:MAG: chorismate mutase [Thalassobium sp.]
MKTIAIQGQAGSFHDEAAKQLYGDESLSLSCTSFAELAEKVEGNDAEVGVMAIENSIAGTLLPNYNLIMSHGLNVIDEIYLQIDQNLMALPGTSIDDLVEIQSHPIALLQCQKYLRTQTTATLVQSTDTASSAKLIAQQGLVGVGAIASEHAAKRYGLEILATGIQTIQQNYTRFLVLSKKPGEHDPGQNKASICFRTSHETGALGDVLGLISRANINLTKLQSIPIPESTWEYDFIADIEFPTLGVLDNIMLQLKEKTSQLTLLGSYRGGLHNQQQILKKQAQL